MTTEQILNSQRAFFKKGETFDVDFRLTQLKKLKQSICENMRPLVQAFKEDYNKCEFDVYSTEVGMVMHELNYMIRNIKKFARPRYVSTSLINLFSRAKIVSVPLGAVLIVSPWNYPFQLTMCPVIGAMAGGNTLIIKPSSKTPRVSEVIAKIMSVFDTEYAYVNCNRDEGLFDLKFDFMFYTGGSEFAKKIREKQAKYLTPCILELGGKSPCIVDIDADIDLAAKRIAWGKFLNAGQTCVAPDYCVLHEDIKKDFVEKLFYYIKKFYYDGEALSDDFPYVITKQKIDEITKLIEGEKILFGGKIDGRKMEPTVLGDITFDSAIMQEEIFAPVLPILEFNKLTDLLMQLEEREKPLAFYYFSKSTAAGKYIAQNTISGGACINDTLMHLTEINLPFGGVGESGYGSYHGKKSYDAFVHYRSVLVKGDREIELKYPPYNKSKLTFIKNYFKIDDR